MKITLIVATSTDGITLQEDGTPEAHHEWTSREDFKFFNSVRDKANLIFMGSKTYEGAKHQMKHSEGKLRIVFSNNPKKYNKDVIKNMLEFTNENPKAIVERLEKVGYREGLLVGGASINSEFFKHNLVTDIYQTVEPVILGKGKGITEESLQVNLELISSEKLNDRGTLLLKYKVL